MRGRREFNMVECYYFNLKTTSTYSGISGGLLGAGGGQYSTVQTVLVGTVYTVNSHLVRTAGHSRINITR